VLSDEENSKILLAIGKEVGYVEGIASAGIAAPVEGGVAIKATIAAGSFGNSTHPPKDVPPGRKTQWT
jgi:hypothetical protein